MEARRNRTMSAGDQPAPHPPALRMTEQRQAVLHALESTHSHPTARQLYEQVRRLRPSISLATIYNSLESLCQVGMVNKHCLDGGPARYCVNYQPHIHLLDTATNRMIDVQLKPGVRMEDVFSLPQGVQVSAIQAYLYGRLPSSSSVS